MPLPPIYFLRHGETDYNAAGRLQGQLDIPLNPKGRAQAARNGGVLAELLPEPEAMAYIASPLLRTQQTMQIARDCLGIGQAGFTTDVRLLEINFGTWEGRTWAEIKRDDPVEMQARDADAYIHAVPGGESYEMVMARVKSWLQSLAQPTVVVSHGGIMRCLRGFVMGLPTADILHLEVPQDKVMLVENGGIRLI